MTQTKNKICIFIFLCLFFLLIFSAQNRVFAQGEEFGDAALRGNPGYNPTTGTITNPDGTLYTGSANPAPASTGSASGGTYQNQEKIPGSNPTSDFPSYLKQIIGFMYAVIGIAAMFMLCIGAYQYLLAAGNLAKVDNAKETIRDALWGLVLGLLSFVILREINPDLVSMKGPSLGGLLGSGSGVSSPGTGAGTPVPGSYTSNAPAEIQQKAKDYAAKNGVPESVAMRMLNAESGGVVDAVSPRGASGLLQLMPGTARGLGVTDIFDVDQNLNAGYKYVSQLANQYNGNWEYAVAAYNMGPGGFNSFMNGSRTLPNETRNYVNKVMGSCSFCN